MRRLLYANLFTGTAASNAGGDEYDFPTFRPGEQPTFALRFLDQVNGSLTQVEMEIAAIRAGIGLVDQPPTTGQFALQVGSGSSTTANTIAAVDWNISPDLLQAALNGLSGITPHDFKVTYDAGRWLIWRTSGASFTLTPRNNTLSPTSFARVRGFSKDGVWINEVRLVQASVAFTDASDTVLPTPPSISSVRDGGTDGVFSWNDIQRLTLPPDFQGSYYLKRGYARTAILSNLSTLEEISTALNAVLAKEDAGATVTNPANNTAFIEFTGELAGADVALLEVVVVEAPAGDLTFVMDLTKAEAWNALADVESREVVFEVEVDYYLDPDDHDAGTRTVKLWSTTVTLARPLLWEGLATEQNIDWLRAPSPKDYVPFTADQVITGPQTYSTVFGNGVATEFTFDHNLNTNAIASILVRQNASSGTPITTGFTIAFDDANSLTLTFTTAPASNSRIITILGANNVSALATHTHTIEQIVGLSDILDDLGSDVAELKNRYTDFGNGSSTSDTTGLIVKIPETARVIGLRGGGGDVWGADGLDLTKLPRFAPSMLGAIHDSTTDNATAVPESPSGNAGKVYKNNASPVLITTPFWTDEQIAQNEFFGCDGELFFKTRRQGTTNSYYATAFEPRLFTLAINSSMLAVKRALTLQFGLETQLANFDCYAQWVLAIDLGVLASDSSPNPVGANLSSITWAASPIFTQTIGLTELLQRHYFGVKIANTVDGMTLDQMIYGKWSANNSAAPASANFVLRARLIEFDTENSPSLAKGFVGYRITPPEGGAAQASIA